MVKLRDQVFQYIDFEPNKIRHPITEEDRQIFHKIISEQEEMGDIVMDDYRFLLQHEHNGAVADKDTTSAPSTEIIWNKGLGGGEVSTSLCEALLGSFFDSNS
ncbi:hypothetical protein C1645_741675 [Glomus cerebriforme]|uniref:Uncharacterized protein n=1 Tax=Glomus cerebriforme TaxID=658196 RepID=A0A397SMI1_9GLOM|nr:hypothetical protein C1645_741675 [Glomus cerebriforme]